MSAYKPGSYTLGDFKEWTTDFCELITIGQLL
jgi:hypothetical protein